MQSTIADIAQALEGNLDAYWATLEFGAPPFLKCVTPGVDAWRFSRDQWQGTFVVPVSIISEKLTEEELWVEFEKPSERV
jgi:hypothetical protein